MRGKREHVSDHAAVGENLGGVADRVDERLVEPPLVDDLSHLREECRTPSATRAQLGEVSFRSTVKS